MRGHPIIRVFVLAIAWIAAALPDARAQAPMADMPPALAIIELTGDEAGIVAVAAAAVALGRTLACATGSTLVADAGGRGGPPDVIAAYRSNITVLGAVTESSLRIQVHDGWAPARSDADA